MRNSGAKTLEHEALWQFSLQLYPANQQLLLDWQDQFGLNVNLALFLLYLQCQNCSLSDRGLSSLNQQLQLFSQQVTQPLRALRRSLPTPWLGSDLQQGLRQQLLSTELAAERLEQQLLLQQYQSLPSDELPLPHSELLGHYLLLLNAPIEQLDTEIFDLYQQGCQLAVQP